MNACDAVRNMHLQLQKDEKATSVRRYFVFVVSKRSAT
jgi:hypothetical protein